MKQYAYTIDNRISSINYSYASNPTPSVAFTYDPYFPRVAAMCDGVGATSWSYAPVGSLGALRLQGETGPAGVVSYSYDALGRTVGRAVDGSAEGFAYDQLNCVIGHTNPLGQFALTYVGQTSQIASRTQTSGTDYPAHTVWSYLPNSEDRRLAGIANTAMRQFDYTTTPENLITGITETGLRHWSYRYDADNRLSGADYVNALKYKLTLDPDGNIAQLTNNSAKTTGAYNDLNELVTKTTAEAVFNYSYDANGNVLSDGQRSYFYDAENRLVGIGYNNSSATTSFAYDGLGRRITITDAVGSQTPVATYYQWCGSRICGRLNASGSPLRFLLRRRRGVVGDRADALLWSRSTRFAAQFRRHQWQCRNSEVAGFRSVREQYDGRGKPDCDAARFPLRRNVLSRRQRALPDAVSRL